MTPPTPSSARAAVIGAGAIGGLTAAFAADAGHDVTLCARTPFDRLTVTTGGEALEPPVRIVTRPSDTAPADWVFLATKAQDTAGAASWLRRLCDARTTVVVLQNGVDHAARTAPLLPPDTAVLPALAFMSVERTAPGRITHHAAEEIHVPAGPAADRLADFFAGGRFRVRPQEDFTTAAWRKLFTNLAANPLTALLGQRLDLLAAPDMAEAAADVLREAAVVARAEGARVGEEDVRRTLRMYASVPPGGGTSMLYDRLAGRPLEHEYITGAVVRAGERHGVPTPLNSLLLAMLRAVDRELRAAAGDAAPDAPRPSTRP